MSVESRLQALEKRLGELEVLLEVIEDRIQALLDVVRDLEDRSSGRSVITTRHLEKDSNNNKDCGNVENFCVPLPEPDSGP